MMKKNNYKVKAPVEKIKISNIGKTIKKTTENKPKFVIILGNFYSLRSAEFLKKGLKLSQKY